MDVNADKKLSLKEFTTGIHLCHLHKPLGNPSAVFRTMDMDGSGAVELDEFVIWLAQVKARDDDASGGGFGRQVSVNSGLVDDVKRAEKLGPFYEAGGGTAASSAASSGASTLGDFLARLGLTKYEAVLAAEDVTTVEGLKCLEKADLKEMGLSTGAASMIVRSL